MTATSKRKPDVPPTRYEREATELLRMELYRRRIGFKDLSKGLKRLGEAMPSSSLANRVNRGKFTVAFVVQCMHAMNMRDFRLDPAPMSEEDVIAAQAEAKERNKTKRPQPKKRTNDSTVLAPVRPVVSGGTGETSR